MRDVHDSDGYGIMDRMVERELCYGDLVAIVISVELGEYLDKNRISCILDCRAVPFHEDRSFKSCVKLMRLCWLFKKFW